MMALNCALVALVLVVGRASSEMLVESGSATPRLRVALAPGESILADPLSCSMGKQRRSAWRPQRCAQGLHIMVFAIVVVTSHWQWR